MIIDTARLQANLENPDWIVFDCRHDLLDHALGEQQYREAHIPGAFFAPVETTLSGTKTATSGRHPLPSPEAFADFLGACGATAQSKIVAYDDVGGQYAARLWWMARWIGLDRAAVLDGGLPKWIAAGLPLASAAPANRPSRRIEVRLRPEFVAPIEETDRASTRSDGLILDARAPERFRGEVEPIDRVAGHIPGARNRFFKNNLNPDLTMRSPEALRNEFRELLGGRRPEEVIHQCGSGITACANLLAMEYAGLPGSKVYAGSWSEWSADPRRPVALGND